MPGGLWDKGAPPSASFRWGAFASGFRPGDAVEWGEGDDVQRGRYRSPITSPSQVRRKRSTVYVEEPEPHLVSVRDADLRHVA